MLAMVLVSQGVVQTLSPYQSVPLLQPTSYVQPKTDANGNPLKDAQGNTITETVTVTNQVIAVGPAASQIAIKQLGTNGGGFFNANSAHPFENPTPFSNFLEMLSILLIPAASCLYLRENGWRHPPGLGATGSHDDCSCGCYWWSVLALKRLATRLWPPWAWT